MGSWDFRSKRVSEQIQIQFYQSYWVKNDAARFVSRTGLKNILPKLINTFSHELETFKPNFDILKIFRKLLKWLVRVLETWYRAQNRSRAHTYSQLHYKNNQ